MNNMDDYPFGPPMGISNYHSPNPPYGLPALSTRAAQNNQTSRNAPVSQPYQPKSAKTNYQSHSTSSSTSQPPSSSRRRAPATFPPTPAQVIELAKEAMRQAIDAGEQPEQNKHGLTVHLQENNIGNLPPDVVDIIKEKLKEELARITLAHNQLSSLPTRFADLTSLRYLNLRQNRFMEFPMVVCELVGLEILDLSRNELTRLPEQLGKLKALKVFSLRHNQVEELPWCLAKMDSLMCLKAESNPLTFPPAPILHAQPDNTLNGMYRDEKEKQDVIITKQVKTYLKQLLREQSIQRERAETESNNGDTSSEGAETPKPVRRVMSGRFPVKVDGKEVPAPDMRSPALPRPPIPIRSHFRGPSQHNATLRRPGITPLSISNSNERLRSNSESLLQRDKNDRSRRMGYINKKANELPSVNEAKANRYSHLRGLSHGSALQSGGGVSSSHDGSGPTSPAESVNGKTGFQRRLSSLPERKRQSESPNAVVEAAKGVLFAIEIGLPLIQRLMVLARTSPKRSSLEMLFYSATPHIEALQDSIYRYETYTEEDEEIAPKSHMEVLSTVMTAIQTHRHVCVSLARNLKPIVRDGADHYIRSLWFILINSMCEMRHSGSILMRALRGGKTLESVGENEAANLTLRPRTQSRPTQPQAQVQVQSRPNFVIPPAAAVSVRQRNQTAAMRNPSNLHVMTDSKNVAKESRANTISSVTPSTGEYSPSSLTQADVDGSWSINQKSSKPKKCKSCADGRPCW